jgi:hypothetical protein
LGVIGKLVQSVGSEMPLNAKLCRVHDRRIRKRPGECV